MTKWVIHVLGPMGASEDLATEAASKDQGSGRSNNDCRVVGMDEGNKIQSQNAVLLQQTADESGIKTTTCMVPKMDGANQVGWQRRTQATVSREARVMTANNQDFTDAQMSRLMVTVLPKTNTHANQAKRDAVPSDKQKAAFAGLQDVVLRAVGNNAPWEHFATANKPWDRTLVQVFSMMLKTKFMVYGPRQLKRIESFAIGTQV